MPEHQVAGFLIGDGRTDVTSPFGIESAPGLSCLWVGSRPSLATSFEAHGAFPDPAHAVTRIGPQFPTKSEARLCRNDH